jgi:hypothetical protein
MSQDKYKYREEAERLLGYETIDKLRFKAIYNNNPIEVLAKVLEEKDELIQEVQELRGEVLWLKKEDK